MSRPRPQNHRLHDALTNLSSSASPDLTRSIMQRLGYATLSRRVARRRAFSKWLSRAGFLAVASLAFAMAWRMFENSPGVRRPAENTIPHAISRDVQRQHERLGTFIQTIRSLTPRIHPGNVEPGALPAHEVGESEPDWPQELRDDVNRTSPAPVRWV